MVMVIYFIFTCMPDYITTVGNSGFCCPVSCHTNHDVSAINRLCLAFHKTVEADFSCHCKSAGFMTGCV